jgi:hypothetical protein
MRMVLLKVDPDTSPPGDPQVQRGVTIARWQYGWMRHRDAPQGKALKYARAERERRFLLARAPDGPCIRRAAISDLYITGTRIRLRRAVETTASGSTTSYKFTQKVPAPAGGPGLITTMYLNEAEHSVLSGLPGSRLTKTRYSVPPFGVDVFTGTLAGLLMAEIEFESAEEEKHFPVPPDVIAEVTADPRLSGGRLTLTKRSELMSLLGEFSLEPLDASELAARTLTAG